MATDPGYPDKVDVRYYAYIILRNFMDEVFITLSTKDVKYPILDLNVQALGEYVFIFDNKHHLDVIADPVNETVAVEYYILDEYGFPRQWAEETGCSIMTYREFTVQYLIDTYLKEYL